MKKGLIIILIFLYSCSDSPANKEKNIKLDNAYKEISMFLDQVLIKNIDNLPRMSFLSLLSI